MNNKTSLLVTLIVSMTAIASCVPAAAPITLPTPAPIQPTVVPIQQVIPPQPAATAVSPTQVVGPVDVVLVAVKQALDGGGVPYQNVQAQVVSNDGTYATVHVSVQFRPSANSGWVDQYSSPDIEVRNVGGQWKVTTPKINFVSTQAPPTASVPTLAPQATRPPESSVWARLINRHSQKCATAPADGSRIVQFTCSSGNEQLWKVSISGAFQLQARSGTCASFTPQHAELIQVSCGASPFWTIHPVGPYSGIPFAVNFPHGHPTVAPQELGTYYQFQNGKFCVDVESYNHDEGGAIIFNDCKDQDNDNQLWAWH